MTTWTSGELHKIAIQKNWRLHRFEATARCGSRRRFGSFASWLSTEAMQSATHWTAAIRRHAERRDVLIAPNRMRKMT